MSTIFVKRYRMTLLLSEPPQPVPPLPDGYVWMEWSRSLVTLHSETKHRAFQEEFDSLIFPALGKYTGCLQLMKDISAKHTFIADATWLLAYQGPTEIEYCGTIQGLGHTPQVGSIQNVGITPAHRHRGLGKILVLKSIEGFRKFAFKSVFLEVTADNHKAVALYESIGFKVTRTMFRTIDFHGRLPQLLTEDD